MAQEHLVRTAVPTAVRNGPRRAGNRAAGPQNAALPACSPL